MENMLLKIIVCLISATLNTAMYLTVAVVTQIVIYKIARISLAKELMKMVAKCATVKIGG